jgi:hypothetical protein
MNGDAVEEGEVGGDRGARGAVEEANDAYGSFRPIPRARMYSSMRRIPWYAQLYVGYSMVTARSPGKRRRRAKKDFFIEFLGWELKGRRTKSK